MNTDAKCREVNLLKETSLKLKLDNERDLNRLENDVKRLDEQVRAGFFS